MQRFLSKAVPCALFALALPVLAGQWIPTNNGAGADSEVRESNPLQVRGSSSEIATRVLNQFPAGDGFDGFDRNSVIYTKFDLTGIPVPPTLSAAFRLTYRNSNFAGNRIQDTVTPNPAIRTGLAVYGINPALAWTEATLNYNNAPGISPDGNVGTLDFNSEATFLGTIAYPEIGNQNHLPIGYELRFCSAALNQYILNAYNAGFSTVTLAAAHLHSGEAPFNNWLNFNYVFNPKEQTTLNVDFYEPGTGVGNIGNLTTTDNSTGAFSPAIAIFSSGELPNGNLCAIYPPPPPPGC